MTNTVNSVRNTKTVSSWSVAVVEIRFGYSATHRGREQGQTVPVERRSRDLLHQQHRERAHHRLQDTDRPDDGVVGHRCVPHRPHDGTDERGITGRVERRR